MGLLSSNGGGSTLAISAAYFVITSIICSSLMLLPALSASKVFASEQLVNENSNATGFSSRTEIGSNATTSDQPGNSNNNNTRSVFASNNSDAAVVPRDPEPVANITVSGTCPPDSIPMAGRPFTVNVSIANQGDLPMAGYVITLIMDDYTRQHPVWTLSLTGQPLSTGEHYIAWFSNSTVLQDAGAYNFYAGVTLIDGNNATTTKYFHESFNVTEPGPCGIIPP
jgi:hypothetical protein